MEGTFIHQILDAGEWETAEKCWKCGWIQKRQQKPLKNRGRTETCEEMWWIYNLKNLKTTLERRNKQLNRWKNWRQEWQCIESSNKISKYVQYFLCFGGNIKNKKKPYKDWWLGWRCVLLFAQGREKKTPSWSNRLKPTGGSREVRKKTCRFGQQACKQD